MIKQIEYFFIRYGNRKKLIPKSLFPESKKFPFKLGDILYTGVNDLLYVGNGKFLMMPKEDKTKLDRGYLIYHYLKNRKSDGKTLKNQFIIRNNQIINYR